MVRYFVSADFENKSIAIELQKKFQSVECMRPVKMEQLHVTLLFYSDLSEEGIQELSAIIRRIQIKRFSAGIVGISGFPTEKRAGVGVILLQSEELMCLHDHLARNGPGGFDIKMFTPHVTVSRARRPCDIRSISSELGVKGSLTFTSVSLVSSKITREGASHEIIERIQLM